MKLSESLIHDRLSTWPSAHLATVSSDKQPHIVPIVFVWHDDNIWSPIDGKPKRRGTPLRVDNILKNPQASLMLDGYDDDWNRLWWLRLDVTARVLSLDKCSTAEHAQAQSAVRRLLRKYPQYRHTPVLGESRTMLMMTPVRINSWSAS